MTERLSHELASLLAEDDGRSDRLEARGLLRARLARNVSEGLGQVPREHDLDEAGTIDHARAAAYLDCALSRAERDAIAVKLTRDPVVRSDLASAARLIDGLETQLEAIPAELVTRAVGILASARPIGPQASAASNWRTAIWSRPAATWSALAAVLLVTLLTPAVVSTLWERNETAAPPATKGVPTRGVAPSPTGKGSDSKSCDETSEQAKPRSGEANGVAKAPDRSPGPPSVAADDDPCRPKPAGEDARKH